MKFRFCPRILDVSRSGQELLIFNLEALICDTLNKVHVENESLKNPYRADFSDRKQFVLTGFFPR